jgi:hypothetical protein
MEYVFKNEDYVLKQFLGYNEHLTIEDYWNGDVLAYTNRMYDNQACCAEMMMQNARGNDHIEKQVVDQIIYKIMIGDIELYGLMDVLDNNVGIGI